MVLLISILSAMRSKYDTSGLVLARLYVGEANVFITVLTPDLGLVRARAQGLRKSGAKLSSALATFSESSLVLVRGREDWRIAGAVLKENWFVKIKNDTARSTATRVSGLLLRIVAGEVHDPKLFSIVIGFFKDLSTFPEDMYDAIEILAVLRILAVLGLDTGEIPGYESEFTTAILTEIMKTRANYIARVNRGITASGL
ncbi:hypothetical protein CO131_01670 [Candidatus Kaiserbacteria bacterium CG_4_9_14_3_um_filter_50_16]|uniref:DNA replication/recombination mediator RecO N-terminal domain-containing protein n=1 Tax=Candidatus Kaiserbacteria bacterium CG17_big_fil_post_rev_8_21_14_2_50_51_7 TaxID=1974613 RepID=A0A2M7FCL1_9BACT|nr:MAG: hypothetical protein COW49_01420 [Candidatus Kaiserbacteria bacterium CG17_big_fil_post_rev_8_21_14_2_50_51_7]PJA00406.1 MAG: hypothetical protein COX76_01825 [Candidatus Kaiserbacteria bacterium CG_4_10_14_0_2_um_filter_50_16]PJA94395.1 MAG: hypothetical protein CO131_01670 [Candidatus Kaiserbacteria bacterium CG_4_9_14_3_um_filter_50_16]